MTIRPVSDKTPQFEQAAANPLDQIDLPDQDVSDGQDQQQSEPQAPFDLNSLPDQTSALQNVHQDVQHLDPDTAASVFKLSDQLNTPEPVVAKNLKEAKIAAIAPDDNVFDQVEAHYPGTKQFLIDPKNMATSRDDIPNLTAHENVIKTASFAQGLWDSIAPQNAWASIKSGFETSSLASLYRNQQVRQADRERNTDDTGFFRQTKPLSEWQYPAQDPTLPKGLSKAELPPTPTPQDPNWVDRAAGTVGGLAGDFPLMGSMAAAGAGLGTIIGGPIGTAVGAAAGGALAFAGPAAVKQYFKERYEKGDIEGVDDALSRSGAILKEAGKQGLVGGVMAAGGAAVAAPFDLAMGTALAPSIFGETADTAAQKVLPNFFKSNVAKNVVGLGTEVGTMTKAGALVEGKDTKLSDYLDNLLVIGAFHGANHVMSHSAEGYIQGQIADQMGDTYDALDKMASESKTAKRDPEKYAAHIDALAKGQYLENVNIPPDALKEFFQTKGIDPDKAIQELGIEDSVNEATASGVDVQIPLGTWLTKVPSDIRQGLHDDIRSHPDFPTANEGRQRTDKTKQDLTDLEANLTTSPFAQSASQVASDIKQQALSAGLSDEEATDHAETYRRFFGKVAAESGQDPYELYKSRGLKINGPDAQGVPPWPGDEGQTFNQGIDRDQAARDALTGPEALDRYNALPESNGGRDVDQDLMRSLYQPYAKDREGAILNLDRTAEPSANLADQAFKERLKEEPSGPVVFLAGGTASGKTQYRLKYEAQHQGLPLIFDSTMVNYKLSEARIQQALDAGHDVHINFIYSPFDQAIEGNKERFRETGRLVDPHTMARTHAGAIDTVLKLQEHFGDKIHVDLFQRNGENIVYSPVDNLNKLRYDQDGQSLRSVTRALEKKATEALKNETDEVRTTKARVGENENNVGGSVGEDAGGDQGGSASALTGETASPEEGLNDSGPKKTFFQSQATSPKLSPLGFYSALGHEIQKMDFKQIPAADLINRIKNLSGVKAEEVEYTGLVDWLKLEGGKVTKDQVTQFLDNEGVKVEQVVLSKDFKDDREGTTETDWQEAQRDHNNDDDDHQNEMEHYASDDYWDDEKTAELRNSLAADYTDADGTVDEAALDKALKEAKNEKASELAQEYVESDDYHGARYDVRDDATGWTLHGSDEIGWYSPELHREMDGDLEEAKVQLLQHMIAKGAIEGSLADHIKPKDIKWKSGTAAEAPTKAIITRRANALLEKEGERLKNAAIERNSFYFGDDGKLKDHYTKKEYNDEVKNDTLSIARDEVEESFNDHTNPKNKVAFSIDHSLIKGDVIGNDQKGYEFELRGKIEKTRDGGTVRPLLGPFKLEGKTIDEAKAEAVKILIDQKIISSDKPAENADGTAPDINEPTGKTKWAQYTEPGGENYREVLLTLPYESGDKTFKSGHYEQKNILAHVRLSDRFSVLPLEKTVSLKVRSDRLAADAKSFADAGISETSLSKGMSDLDIDQRKSVIASVISAVSDAEIRRSIIKLIPVDVVDDIARSKSTPDKLFSDNSMLADSLSGDANATVKLSPDSIGTLVSTVAAFVTKEVNRAADPIGLASERGSAEGTDNVHKPRRTLFIEEMQSDMHQQGREKGYISEGGEVPDAPFKNTEAWAALALKRMLRMAVEQGYDSVAWTPAKTHVDRWGTDNISWAKAQEYAIRRIDNPEGTGGEKGFKSKDAAEKYIKENMKQHADEWEAFPRGPHHWLVGSAEQRGGRADGVDIEALARQRGELLERNGEKVHTKEELKAVIADTLGRERDDRSLESLTDSVWKQMQEADSGAKNPRKEGMEFFYDNMLPKKVAPKILKPLDPSAKVEVGKFDTGENDVSAKPEYSGPELSASALLDMRGDPLNATYSRQAKDVADALDDGTPFKDAIEKWGSPGLAEAVGGKFSDMPKKLLESWEIPITDTMKEKIKLGQSLFQGDETDAQGRIRFGRGQTIIDLFKTANKSTFSHESAHLFLEVVGQVANHPDASVQLKKDYQTVLDYLGVKSPDEIKVEHHETFAKSWEAYLMEGKAPAPELQGAFARMRDWLLAVYKNVKSLGVSVTPEIRKVFDRMLATNAEIDDARAQVGLNDDVSKASSPEVARKIRTIQEQARDFALRTLLRPQMQELQSQKKEFLNKERQRLETSAEAQVKNQPLFKAIMDILEVAKKKKATDLAKAFLDRTIDPKMEARFEALAEVHGFESGDDLAGKILSDGSPEAVKAQIKQIVDEGMKPHEGALDKEQIQIEALKAIHNDKQGEVLALEHQALLDLQKTKEIRSEVTKRNRIETKMDIDAAKSQAAEILQDKTLRDAGQYRTYVTAERNAAVKVTKALANGDYEAAAAAKREQMLSHQLVSQAIKNREEITKNLKYLNALTKRGRTLNDMPYGFVRQVDKLLSTFGLMDQRPEDSKNLMAMAIKMTDAGETPADVANATGLKFDRGQWAQESLVDFLSRINENYYRVHVPDSVLNGSADTYRDMTFSELRDLRGSAQTISEIGKTYDRFLTAFDKTDIRAAAKELRASVEEKVGTKYQERKSIGSSSGSKYQDAVRAIKDLPDSVIPSLVNILTLAHVLDGGEVNGPAKEYIYRPIKAAENNKIKRFEMMTNQLDTLFREHYTPKELANYKKDRTYQEAFSRYLTKEEVLSLALNFGNEGNIDRITRGYRVDERQVLHVINTVLSKNDMDFVQKVWDHLDTYWPDIKALEMRINGVEPKQVDRARLDTAHGSYAGGYYPISYDFEKSSDAFANAEQKNELFRQFSAAQAQTDSGHTESRVSTLARPIRLSLDVLFNHLDNVVHDLEFRPAIIDVQRFLNQPDAKAALENALGIKAYRGVVDWLKSVASDQSEYLSAGERVFQFFRFSSTLSQLAIKPMALMLHFPSNIINSASEIGALKTGSVLTSAMMDAVRGQGDLNTFVFDNSEMMKQRHMSRDRDILDMSKKWKGTNALVPQYAFVMLHLADKAVSVPLWADTYKANLEEFGSVKAKQIADETIVRTLGSGSPVDRIGAQRGSELKKITTMFYSWMSVMFNRAWAQGKFSGLAYNKGNVGQAVAIAATATVYTWLLPALHDALVKEIVRNSSNNNEDDRKKRIAGTVLEQPFSYLPIVRDIALPIMHQALGERGEDHYKISPLESAVESIIMPVGKAVNIAFTPNKHMDEKFAEQTARGVSTALGVPQQLDTWAFNLLDYSKTEGEASYKDFLSRRTKH